MNRTGQLGPAISAGLIARIVLYTFFVLLLQVHLVSRLPYPALRTDLLLPLMFVVAVEWPPVAGLIWASFWGFLADNFSGQFWGLHVGSYTVAVCLVHMASEKFDCHNPVYQMCLVGLCALGQSIALGLFLSFVPMDSSSLTSVWIGLGIRTLLSMTLAPFLIYPILNPRSSF
ncbi:MAG: rod shape-determining protein MreD [Syntrophobacteraceae bacterium]